MHPTLTLHIEDNFHNRRLVRKVLELQGYPLVEAEDGIVGLELFHRLRPTLVLLDIGLPGYSGLEILRAVKADPDLAHIPVITITASAHAEDRERFLTAGFDAYLSKPVPPLALLETVRAFDPRLHSMAWRKAILES